MINFYPGPSKINEGYINEISKITSSGLSSFNHRSIAFKSAFKHTVNELHNHLDIPADYDVIFLSSATECWEVVCRQFKNDSALFLETGAFSSKWRKQAQHLMKEVSYVNIDKETSLEHQTKELPKGSDLICYADCETSNSLKFTPDAHKNIRENNSESLIVVDATSSLGGVKIDINTQDITFASVQKCLGLPPGLAVMILSPKAVSAIRNTKKSFHYNDLNNILDNSLKHETTHTPNTQLIIALGKTLKSLNTDKIDLHYQLIHEAVEKNEKMNFHILNEENRSKNVFCISHHSPSFILNNAEANGFILGKGYGELKDLTFRIANFPSHTTEEIKKLCNFISSCTM